MECDWAQRLRELGPMFGHRREDSSGVFSILILLL
jgi:hypothetical protein